MVVMFIVVMVKENFDEGDDLDGGDNDSNDDGDVDSVGVDSNIRNNACCVAFNAVKAEQRREDSS